MTHVERNDVTRHIIMKFTMKNKGDITYHSLIKIMKNIHKEN